MSARPGDQTYSVGSGEHEVSHIVQFDRGFRRSTGATSPSGHLAFVDCRTAQIGSSRRAGDTPPWHSLPERPHPIDLGCHSHRGFRSTLRGGQPRRVQADRLLGDRAALAGPARPHAERGATGRPAHVAQPPEKRSPDGRFHPVPEGWQQTPSPLQRCGPPLSGRAHRRLSTAEAASNRPRLRPGATRVESVRSRADRARSPADA